MRHANSTTVYSGPAELHVLVLEARYAIHTA